MSVIEVSERSFEPLVLHRSTVMPVVVVAEFLGIQSPETVERFFEALVASYARA